LWVEDLHDAAVEADGDALPGEVVADRVLDAGDEALRILKRRLSDVVYAALRADLANSAEPIAA